MAQVEFIQRTNSRQEGASNTIIASWLSIAICLLLALGLGTALPSVLNLPKTWALLICLLICGVFIAALWLATGLPLIPLLRFALLSSFWFRMEINLFPIFKNHAEPPGLNISLGLLLSVLLAVNWLSERWPEATREPVFPRSFSLTLTGVFLWCCLTVAYGAEGMLGIYALWSVASSMLMCFITAAFFSERRQLEQLVVWLAALIAFNALFGIAQAFIPALANFSIGTVATEETVAVAGEEVSRVRALFAGSNPFAWTLVLFLPIIIAPLLLRVTSLRRWQRTLCVLATGAAVIVLILTYSRGSWLAFALSVPLMTGAAFWILKGIERQRLLLRFAGVIVLVSVLALPFAGVIISRLTGDDRGSAESRVQLIQVALAMIADNAVLGVGLSGYETVMTRYDETPGFITQHFDWPVHNIYLQIAAETGLPGLLLFLVMAVLALWRGWMVLRNADAAPMQRALALGLLTGMLAYLVTGLKEGSCFQSGQMRLFFLFCGLLFACERANRYTPNEPAVELFG
jgi:putative inorganic carbon (hco3(-)) transporter